ncbi:MAG: MerR family transcriptional regulator [Lachnospiraceae bacterium]|jgi:DNA-binding transcriptional MerR regulator|nr:MerR family transcriptional regulator [Lachnospiraceae bacterium]
MMTQKSKNRAIPDGFMTVGELAKKMGVTVRTLQHYDKEGLLTPSAESEGGFRLYSYKDMVRLNQILSMKYLGFSLSDIKGKLTNIDTPQDMERALADHAEDLRAKIKVWSQALEAIEILKKEVVQMQTVNFQKYAAIIVNLQMDNEFYGMVKHMDSEFIDRMGEKYTQTQAKDIVDKTKELLNTAIRYKEEGVDPASEKAQALVKEFWERTLEVMDGDIDKLMQMAHKAEQEGYLPEIQVKANEFINPALTIYFTKQGGIK